MNTYWIDEVSRLWVRRGPLQNRLGTALTLNLVPGLLAGVLLLALAWPGTAPAAPALAWLKGGHSAPVNGVACAPGGGVIATASDDATVKLWTTNGTLLTTLTVDGTNEFTSVAFSPDGTKLAAGMYRGATANSGQGQTVVWQTSVANSWQPTNISILRLTVADHIAKVTCVAFSADSTKYVTGGAEGSNIVRRVSDGTALAMVAGYNVSSLPAAVNSVAFSSGGLLASGADDNTIAVWNSSWSPVWSTQAGQSSNVTAVAFSPDGTKLLTGSLDTTLKVWNATAGMLIQTLAGHTSGVNAAAWSPDGTEVVSGSSDQTAIIWNAESGTAVATLSGHVGPVNAVTFMANGQEVVTGGRDNTMKQWAAPGGTLLQSVGDQTGYIRAVAVATNEMLLASLSDDRTIAVRRVVDGGLVARWVAHSDWASALVWSPDGTMLASGGGTNDAPIKLWTTNGSLVRTITNGCNGVGALAWSPDGTRLAAGGDFAGQVIQIWNPVTGALLETLGGHSNGVTALAFSPDGTMLASGGRVWDNAVKLWRLTYGVQVGNFTDLTANGVTNGALGLAWSPDGTSVSASGDEDSLVRVWKVAGGTVAELGSGSVPVPFVEYAPNGGTLASGLQSAVDFWNVTNDTLLQSYTQETFQVSCLDYSKGGDLYAYGRADATVALASTAGWGAVQSLTLQATNVLQAGETAQVVVWAGYATTTNNVTADPDVIYSSSNTNVFTVSATGLLSGWSTGAATLTVAFDGVQVNSTVNIGSVAPGVLQVGVGYPVHITLVDQYQNASSFSGTKLLTFDASLSPGADGSGATVNGVTQRISAPVTFTSGTATVILVAHISESGKTLTVTDGTLSSSSPGGTNLSLGTIVRGTDSAYQITAATTTPSVETSDVLTINLVDQYQNPSAFAGGKSLTFGGLSTGLNGTLASVNGTAFGTATPVNFTAGAGSATLVAQRAEDSKLLAVSDGTLSSTNAGGAAPLLSPRGVVLAGTAYFTRAAGLNLRILITDLLTNATDIGSSTLLLTGVSSPSTNGINVTTNTTYLLYPGGTNNVTDSFNYDVADAYGGSATGLVVISIVAGQTGQTNASVTMTNNVATITFAGIPGDTYVARRATNLTPPVVWVNLSTNVAPALGLFQVNDSFGDLGAPPAQAYYQLQAR